MPPAAPRSRSAGSAPPATGWWTRTTPTRFATSEESGEGEHHAEGRPAAGALGGLHRPAVGTDDGVDDRQAEAAPARCPVPGLVGPVEAFEQPARVEALEARPVVGHLDHRRAGVGPDPYPHPGARGRVGPGVRQQVGQHLAQPPAVADHGDGLGGVEVDRVVRRGGPGVGHGVDGQRPEVDGGLVQRAPLVEAGQEQQVVHQDAHALGLLLDAAHGDGQVLGALGRTPAEELGVAPDRRQRGPQLVGGIRHEPPEPRLGGGPFGEGRLDLAEHGVEGQAQPAHLGALVGRLDPTGQVPGGDGPGGGADGVERTQADADDPGRQPADEHQDGDGDDELDPHQPRAAWLARRSAAGPPRGCRGRWAGSSPGSGWTRPTSRR